MAMTMKGLRGAMDQPFDVCIITTIHGDFDNRIYQRQLDALVGAGMRVCMVAPWDFPKRTRTDYDFVATPPPTTRASRVGHGLRTLKAASGVKARVYIFHDPDFLPFAQTLRRRSGGAVIYDCHENIPEDILDGKDWIPRPLRKPVSASFRQVEDRVVRALGRVIVSVPHLQRRFQRQGVEVALVRNFPNFDVPEMFAHEEALLYTGSLSRDYGFDMLLALARELKRRGNPIRMRIVDRFYKSAHLRAELVQAIAAEGLNVELLKPCKASEMPQLLAKGSIGLSPLLDTPNKALAYPTKIFEFYAFGLPVIATDIAGTREILEDGRLGVLVPARDAAAWADAVEDLQAHPSKADEYRQRARAAYVKTYNWAAEREVLIAFVQCVLEGRRALPASA